MIEMIESTIPAQHTELFGEYVECLKRKLDRVMWVVLDNGHKIMQLEKQKHVEMVKSLLSSGDERRERVAVEVMKRSLGEWRIR